MPLPIPLLSSMRCPRAPWTDTDACCSRECVRVSLRPRSQARGVRSRRGWAQPARASDREHENEHEHENVYELDVVKLAGDEHEHALYCVEGVDAEGGRVTLEPLVADGDIYLRGDAEGQLERAVADLIVVPATFAQRIDPDRVSNPHGEHAEDTWELL